MLILFVALAYIFMSVVTFGAYGYDKRAARTGRWRLREADLHVLSLFGGLPGALVGQKVFRHKTRKASFRLRFQLIGAIHIAAWTLIIWWQFR